MGRKFDDARGRRGRSQRAPYKIFEAPNGDAWVQVGGREMSPPEVSAIILAQDEARSPRRSSASR